MSIESLGQYFVAIEDAPIQHPGHLARLRLVVALALCCAVPTGLWDVERHPVPAEKRLSQQPRTVARSRTSWVPRGLRHITKPLQAALGMAAEGGGAAGFVAGTGGLKGGAVSAQDIVALECGSQSDQPPGLGPTLSPGSTRAMILLSGLITARTVLVATRAYDAALSSPR